MLFAFCFLFLLYCYVTLKDLLRNHLKRFLIILAKINAMSDIVKRPPLTGAERASRCREKKKLKEAQVANTIQQNALDIRTKDDIIRDLTNNNTRLHDQIIVLEDRRLKEISSFQSEIANLNTGFNQQMQAEIAKLQAEHQAELAKLQAGHQAEIAKLNTAYQGYANFLTWIYNNHNSDYNRFNQDYGIYMNSQLQKKNT